MGIGEVRPKCNGLPEICDLPVNQEVRVGIHNTQSIDWGFISNQYRDTETLLKKGYRFFLMDPYQYKGELVLCHKFCRNKNYPLRKVFEVIVDFLEKNPREELVIIFEDYAKVEAIQQLMVETGLYSLLYDHPGPKAPWPKVEDLIQNNQRVIAFFWHGGKSRGKFLNAHQYYIGEDTYLPQNPLNKNPKTKWNCKTTLGPTEAPAFGQLANQWVNFGFYPSRRGAKTTNNRDSMVAHLKDCFEKHQRIPILWAFNFVRSEEDQDLLGFAREMNLKQWDQFKPSSTPKLTLGMRLFQKFLIEEWTEYISDPENLLEVVQGTHQMGENYRLIYK